MTAPRIEQCDPLWAIQPDAFTALAPELFATPRAAATAPGEPASSHCAGSPILLTATAPEQAPLYELVNGVAVIPVDGVISRGGWWGASLTEISDALSAALADPAARAILFSIHSPGGQAAGVKEVADAIYEARRIKPCAAWVDGLCASAAYWLASATGAIYAGPSSVVGSIGVILRHMDKSGWNKEMGLAFTYVTAGSYKAVGHPDAALSERDLGVLQSRVDAIYDMFCGDVAQRMGLALDNRAAWADGRDFLASEAEELGLVTAIVSSRAEAIKQILKETNMDKAELTKNHPELLAAIQEEATQAALQKAACEKESAVDAAVASVIALVETACGKETGDRVRALVTAGVTPEQLKATAAVLGAPVAAPGAGTSEKILDAIKQATPAPVADGSGASTDDVAAMIARIGAM